MSEKGYYRIMAGAKSTYINECLEGGFIGASWGFKQDLTQFLFEEWRKFNKEMIPVFITNHPEKSRVAAGLACGMLHTICKGMSIGDVVLCPSGKSAYHIGVVTSEYYYAEDEVLPHRRKVSWLPDMVTRESMSVELKNSLGSVGTVSNASKYYKELESLITYSVIDHHPQPQYSMAEQNESVFALEKHLEDFLVKNWKNTVLGEQFDIYTDDGEVVGQQYQTDTGPMDILAISKDKMTLLVVELKRDKASDSVVGQVQRYMGFVKEFLCESNQTVRGVIIAFDDDIKIRRALSVTNNIDFYRYQVSFKLVN